MSENTPAASRPLNRIVPPSAFCAPAKIDSSVVLPQPLAPTIPTQLSLGYGKLKKYAKALEVQKKAYEIIKTLYPHNKAQLGTNYLLMTLNTSIAYYQNSNNAEALKFLQEAENIANELKELNQLFSSYPLVVRFAKGDLLAKLSQPGSEELLKAGLEYKSGTLPNDAVLLYLINDYRTNNNSIYRK